MSDTWGEELLNHEKESSSDFNRQSTSGKKMNNAQDVDENDPIHTKMMEFEALLEASGECNPRGSNLMYGDGDPPYTCVASYTSP